ncbi:hypothetical protein ACOME3_001453 [Neoechinorhynchus agilis]
MIRNLREISGFIMVMSTSTLAAKRIQFDCIELLKMIPSGTEHFVESFISINRAASNHIKNDPQITRLSIAAIALLYTEKFVRQYKDDRIVRKRRIFPVHPIKMRIGSIIIRSHIPASANIIMTFSVLFSCIVESVKVFKQCRD